MQRNIRVSPSFAEGADAEQKRGSCESLERCPSRLLTMKSASARSWQRNGGRGMSYAGRPFTLVPPGPLPLLRRGRGKRADGRRVRLKDQGTKRPEWQMADGKGSRGWITWRCPFLGAQGLPRIHPDLSHKMAPWPRRRLWNEAEKRRCERGRKC